MHTCIVSTQREKDRDLETIVQMQVTDQREQALPVIRFRNNLIGIVEPARAITVHVTWHMNTHGDI